MIEVLSEKPNARYLPIIQAGVNIGLRPSAVLLRDHHALNRSMFTRELKEPIWTSWDYALMEAATSITAFTNPETGQYLWLDQSDKVEWKVVITDSGSLAALERYRKSNRGQNLEPGEQLRLEAVYDEETKPRFSEWINKSD